ncbi:kelch domain-containing protein 10 homolog [Prorops nasuta]|uniref:kelch domain-containing protein 10 homolog n=1 Tax=Prorops nasuta TaxID=863751 RepID=UPI0034CECAB8
MYKFRPFVFEKHEPASVKKPKGRSGHRIACDGKYMYSFGGFNPGVSVNDPDMLDNPNWAYSIPLLREMWRMNLVTNRWQRLPNLENIPNEVASNAMILVDNALIIYGGTGVPFGYSCSNQLYVYNIDNKKMWRVPAKGQLPKPQYGQALIYHNPYLYTVGGTSGSEYSCDIHRLNIKTHVWEAVYICRGRDPAEPSGRYRHELAFDGTFIYILGGGTSEESYGFYKIPAFDIEKNKWVTLNTKGDCYDESYPEARRCHGCVQHTDQETGVTSVIISGGYNGDTIFSDVWKLDVSHLQWTCLRTCVLPRPVYFQSAALSKEGCMYTFGGIVKTNNNEFERTDDVHSTWLVIPKLSEICLQALSFYYLKMWNKSREELLELGIPLRFVERIEHNKDLSSTKLNFRLPGAT